uniref:Uncharacterized protein n=1 Tax=Tanacetum cinerariifolium TaxID=118510 RepID=A0A699GE65_TANCI|nr:hypothetical protein [Tanacetum cinerariifolium]
MAAVFSSAAELILFGGDVVRSNRKGKSPASKIGPRYLSKNFSFVFPRSMRHLNIHAHSIAKSTSRTTAAIDADRDPRGGSAWAVFQGQLSVFSSRLSCWHGPAISWWCPAPPARSRHSRAAGSTEAGIPNAAALVQHGAVRQPLPGGAVQEEKQRLTARGKRPASAPVRERFQFLDAGCGAVLHAAQVHQRAHGAVSVLLVDGLTVGFAELDPQALGSDELGAHLGRGHGLEHALVHAIEIGFHFLLLPCGARVHVGRGDGVLAVEGVGAGCGQQQRQCEQGFSESHGASDRIEHLLVNIAPPPAAHVAADQARAQMHPGVAHFEAFLAAVGVGGAGLDLAEMSASVGHGILLVKRAVYPGPTAHAPALWPGRCGGAMDRNHRPQSAQGVRRPARRRQRHPRGGAAVAHPAGRQRQPDAPARRLQRSAVRAHAARHRAHHPRVGPGGTGQARAVRYRRHAATGQLRAAAGDHHRHHCRYRLRPARSAGAVPGRAARAGARHPGGGAAGRSGPGTDPARTGGTRSGPDDARDHVARPAYPGAVRRTLRVRAARRTSGRQCQKTVAGALLRARSRHRVVHGRRVSWRDGRCAGARGAHAPRRFIRALLPGAARNPAHQRPDCRGAQPPDRRQPGTGGHGAAGGDPRLYQDRHLARTHPPRPCPRLGARAAAGNLRALAAGHGRRSPQRGGSRDIDNMLNSQNENDSHLSCCQ